MKSRTSFWSVPPHGIPCLMAATLLFGALGRWPYGYYTLLRIISCAAAAFTVFCFWGTRHSWATWAFGIIAILFNPLIPIHLSREIWQPLDVVAACAFILGGLALRIEDRDQENGGQLLTGNLQFKFKKT